MYWAINWWQWLELFLVLQCAVMRHSAVEVWLEGSWQWWCRSWQWLKMIVMGGRSGSWWCRLCLLRMIVIGGRSWQWWCWLCWLTMIVIGSRSWQWWCRLCWLRMIVISGLAVYCCVCGTEGISPWNRTSRLGLSDLVLGSEHCHCSVPVDQDQGCNSQFHKLSWTGHYCNNS